VWRDALGVIFESGGLDRVKKEGYVAMQQQKIIIKVKVKVKADKPQRKNEEDKPIIPAGMMLNRFHNIKVSESSQES
jgi:hypothetical protein